MKKIINHCQIYKKGVYGGVVNTTLCGRVNNYENEKNNGMNVNDDFNCKFCLKIAQTNWGKKIIENSKNIFN